MMSASELTCLQTEFRNDRSRQALADAQSLQDLQNAGATGSIASHLSGDDHKVIVSAMRAAATAGAGQVQMIRFPSAACTDLGRRINSAQPGWGSTLQGRPADIYMRVEHIGGLLRLGQEQCRLLRLLTDGRMNSCASEASGTLR